MCTWYKGTFDYASYARGKGSQLYLCVQNQSVSRVYCFRVLLQTSCIDKQFTLIYYKERNKKQQQPSPMSLRQGAIF